jgi:hypothetical protein
MRSGTTLAILFLIFAVIIALGSSGFRLSQKMAKADPRVFKEQNTVLRLKKNIQELKADESTLKEIRRTMDIFQSTPGYEGCIEVSELHYLKAKAFQHSKDHDQAIISLNTALESKKQWRNKWEGVNAQSILDRLQVDFQKADPKIYKTFNDPKQVMVMVGHRADQLLEGMKAYELFLKKCKILEKELTAQNQQNL